MNSSDNAMAIRQQPLPKAWAGIFLIIGVACGLLTHLVTEHTDDVALSFSLSQALLLGALLFVLSARPGKVIPATVFALAVVFCQGLLSTTAIYRFGVEFAENSALIAILCGQSIVFSYIALPFFQTWLDDGDLSFSYEGLFVHSWNNGLLALVGHGFMGLFWLILFLFALLFESVGIDALQRLIEETYFAIPATTTATALGIFIARDHARIVAALRAVLFSLLSVLNPVFLLLAIGFLGALALGGFEKLSSVISASATLLSLITIGVILSNAVLRDGSEILKANRLLRYSTIALLPALLCFCGFAYYAIHLRISDYGLTPERVWIAVATGFLSIYCLAYVLSFMFRGRWMAVCRRANVFIALAVAATALVMQTPLADPFVLSAKSQYERLISGAADPQSFDFGFLKFELGGPGHEVLKSIAEDSGAASKEIVAENLARLAAANHYWEWKQPQSESETEKRRTTLGNRNLVQRIPSDLSIPNSEAIFTLREYDLPLRNCAEAGKADCLIASVDLTDHPGNELIFAIRENGATHIYLLEQEDKAWRVTVLRYNDVSDDLWDALSDGQFSSVPSDHRDLKIGNAILRLRQTNGRASLERFAPGETSP
ncbi:DUF4153 domain-containing protein [Pelagibius sp. Alg239-R121]|uniref:DUF4153 domain-containing protein n=1 Tax=Pelagibius sp. Alg239-R121 TaxID=2993448 RepID=UPI0024A6B22B|nr:DUF4153 domain-containing protein [Pelagibius sp. Alg239-R121]